MAGTDTQEIIDIIKEGGIGVLRTDTLYGVVGSALNVKAVEAIYKIKGRDTNKPFIILISDINQVVQFGVDAGRYRRSVAKYWPGPNTLIFPSNLNDLWYLHRGQNSLAFRLPNKPALVEIIHKTGPLVAPSANPQGLEPAMNIVTAKRYFGSKVDFYLDDGLVESLKPSAIIEMASNKKLR